MNIELRRIIMTIEVLKRQLIEVKQEKQDVIDELRYSYFSEAKDRSLTWTEYTTELLKKTEHHLTNLQNIYYDQAIQSTYDEKKEMQLILDLGSTIKIEAQDLEHLQEIAFRQSGGY